MTNLDSREDLPALLERLQRGPWNPGLLLEACELSLRQGQPRTAANLARRLAHKLPDRGIAHFTLGRALYDLGEFPAAAEAFARAATLDPANGAPRARLALVLVRLGRGADALRLAQDLLARPGLTAPTLLLLGEALGDLGQFREAREACERALAAGPDAAAHARLAEALEALDDHDGALEHHRRALDLEPSAAHLANLSSDLLAAGDAQAGLPLLERALALDPARRDWAAAYLMYCNRDPGMTHERLFRQGGDCLERACPSRAPVSARDHDRDPGRRLRIGYVSPNFRAHAMAHWLPPLLEARDRERFSVTVFAENTLEDAWTRRYRAQADEWVATAGQSAQAVAAGIRRRKVDILVDLAGASDGNRLDVFALKPAPVQAAMLGFDRSTGLRAMDWRLTTELADPPGVADPWNVERIWRLDGCFCYSPPVDAPEPGPLPALGGGGLQFGFLGTPSRAGADFMGAAARLLRELPEARLHLLCRTGADQALRDFKLGPVIQAGVDPHRVVFHPALPSQAAFLAYYRELDIMLNSFPADAGTTLCESLWMGVPALVLDRPEAMRHTGRALMTCAGMADWVASGLDDWIAAARRWSGDLEALAALRSGLRARFKASPLCDPAQSMRAIEAAYRGMWQDFCADMTVGGPRANDVRSPSPHTLTSCPGKART